MTKKRKITTQSDTVAAKLQMPAAKLHIHFHFFVDKDDYSVLQGVLKDLGYDSSNKLWKYVKWVTIQEGSDRPVYILHFPKNITSLPPSIGQLRFLQELDLA
eukprot:CAMPEP_0116150864 /NCGR_PEP_ID=MMETSP0329-20121206/19787_1 /TAXON_ID=697910 /ORGANISM="Pseudo-nitzschia arenysensis, Strain B593" /LENGTH=101 /DNA_ID=CAMNT_0003647431 /DNA_START=22 /DNA_END=323 /DNA_ORIENTATION=+